MSVGTGFSRSYFHPYSRTLLASNFHQIEGDCESALILAYALSQISKRNIDDRCLIFITRLYYEERHVTKYELLDTAWMEEKAPRTASIFTQKHLSVKWTT